MNPIGDAFVAIRSYFEAGGDVLWAILFVTALMWTFIIERLWYFRTELPARISDIAQEWSGRQDTTSWFARRIRDEMVSGVSVDAHRYLLFIKTLMAVLPLLGLLGTVTGMIQVFDVMAMTGTGNARLMAGGVSAATIPTMSGLVAALSGLYLATYLEQKANSEVERTEDLLVRH
ncbi:MAG TPA: MotA/TolQ/ExbB proton channel family protein [Gammaproteobacteria bacterium]|nr:MotA/TolQ/ExbB proton channel family protein [Gammaproteobacteria bacterium]